VGDERAHAARLGECQRFAVLGLALLGQAASSRAPQSSKKRAPASFSAWHRGHFMPEPPSSLAGEGRNGGPKVARSLSRSKHQACPNILVGSWLRHRRRANDLGNFRTTMSISASGNDVDGSDSRNRWR
jgi:hypothetical protein